MKKLIPVLLLIIGVLIGVYITRLSESNTHKAAPINNPVGTSTATSTTISIEDFVKNNISSLSPESEVLGGTFYITQIEARGGAGTVSYEDGHNAYTADFTYRIDPQGHPQVESFIVRK